VKLKIGASGLPVLDQFCEEGFVDCVFDIINMEDKGEIYKFDLRASYSGDDLGINVEVLKGMESGFDSEMSLIQDHVYYNGVKFIRSGSESDRLITVLATLYGADRVERRMVSVEVYTAIVLHQGEIDFSSEPIKIKLFGKDQDENYYESFFNLDLKNGLVFWNEKDEEYRDPLIRGLSEA
jgi:hypothetical protein